MFDIVLIGKKIANLRKEKNMTQMELADLLGVSYQAVSNWERGNSMPDISKLPELTAFLSCSIDELLSGGEETTLLKHVAFGDAESYIQDEKITLETIVQAAPVLKPKQTESLMDTILNEKEDSISIQELIGLAPFISEEYLERYTQKLDMTNHSGEICGLAPFLSEATLGRLALKCNLNEIISLAPFLSRNTLDQLIEKTEVQGKIPQLVGLAPFLSERALDTLIMKAIECGETADCAGYYPFLGKETLHKLADVLLKKGGVNAFQGLAPYI